MEVNIRKGTKKDIDRLIDLHLSSFNGFFMATLGAPFLKQYYKAALKSKRTICLFLTDNENNDLGFVIGRYETKGYLKHLIKINLLGFGLIAIRLLFARPNALQRLINNLSKKSVQIVDTQEYAEIGLIGVDPSYQNTGAGYKLLCEFENKLKSKNVKLLSLTTDKDDNDNVLKTYKRWGFSIMYEFITYPNRSMYRLIKEL